MNKFYILTTICWVLLAAFMAVCLSIGIVGGYEFNDPTIPHISEVTNTGDFIRTDGTSVTSARIPFLLGISTPFPAESVFGGIVRLNSNTYMDYDVPLIFGSLEHFFMFQNSTTSQFQMWNNNLVGELFNIDENTGKMNVLIPINSTQNITSEDQICDKNGCIGAGVGTTYYADENYINKNTTDAFVFNESKMNNTINILGLLLGFNSTYNASYLYYSDGTYIIKNSTNGFNLNETVLNNTIKILGVSLGFNTTVNIFDQTLNTTSNVTFDNITANNVRFNSMKIAGNIDNRGANVTTMNINVSGVIDIGNSTVLASTSRLKIYRDNSYGWVQVPTEGLRFDTSYGVVSIGVAPNTQYTLAVKAVTTSTVRHDGASFVVGTSGTGTKAAVHGFENEVNGGSTATGIITDATASFNQLSITSAENITTGSGVVAKYRFYSNTGKVTNYKGLSSVITLAGGNVSNTTGLYIENPTKTTGTIDENYGIYLENQSAGTVNYAIYSVDGRSYFGGNVTIGKLLSLSVYSGTLPTCNVRGLVANNGTGLYYCNSTNWNLVVN